MPVCGGSAMRSARRGTNLTSPAARTSSSSLALSACRARRESRRHLYLGYWIKDHVKMDYKRRFQPLEVFDGRRWVLDPGL